MKLWILACAGALLAGPACAQRQSNVSATVLLNACAGHATQACDAYLDGFSDAIRAGGKAHALACIPDAVTGTELRDTLVAYLKAHPQDQHLKAGAITVRALQAAYPCKS